MSAQIKRSISTIKTELEFLKESNVITNDLYEHLISGLPENYSPGMQPIDLKIFATSLQDDNLSSIFSKLSTGGTNITSIASNSTNTTGAIPATTTTTIQKPLVASKPKPPITPKRDNFEYAEALYDYIPQQKDDLQFKSGDKIKIIEKKSEYWWLGEINSKTGMMPANYVKLLANNSTNNNSTSNLSLPVSSNTTGSYNEKKDDLAPPSYSAPSGPPPSSTYQQQQQQQPYQQQELYKQQQPYQQQPYQQQPYQQNAVQPYQQQQVQQQQPQTVLVENPQGNNTNNNQVISDGAKKFGSKLGNAAIFGAGATIGSNIVNSIF
ncbi:hypothetical protein B5S33_g4531 [[Candida] boidinii]|nr:hypothetical protein B5S30_g5250 [[Candida] boidinii]OWB85857.1 hypothetical protein B5S33_g4531 [[Candida] boidinii]GMF58160.1 unnamed protein product [[Candida] boidinii]